MKSTAESQHASIERNKEAVQVKCSWKRNLPEVNTADTNIVHCCSQNCLSLFANEELSADLHVCSMRNMERRENVQVVVIGVVKSVHTCGCTYLFLFFSFFFLLYLQTFYLLFLNNSYPFLVGFHENELGTTFSSCLFSFFFAFFDFHCKK